MSLRRVPLPAWAANATAGGPPGLGIRLTGEQAEWGVAIPWVFRALAAPDGDNQMVEAPRPGDDVWAATAYWCPLVHLLVYSLGWTHPGAGLRWWYDAGFPRDDARLRLIDDIWGAAGDQQLDWFAAWLWTAGAEFGIGAVDSEPLAARPPVDRQWVERQASAAENWGGPSPLVGGSDPLHLSAHWKGPLERPLSAPMLLRSEADTAQAVLVTDSMAGWYQALSEAGAALPPLGDRSWRVDVVVRPAGWLGTYRRSRATGRWFAGRHRHHAPGAVRIR